MSAIKNKSLLLNRFLSVIPVALVALYCLWYWSNSHEALTSLYMDLNPAFYKAGEWGNFFTEGIKRQGNWWCATALLAAVFLAWRMNGRFSIALPKTNLKPLPLMLVLACGTALAIKAWTQSRPASDEVFSALALAGLPSFQTLSYYPLPNNHVFFNLLNGCFSIATEDLVFTGRLLSVFTYLAVLALTFFFFVKLIRRQWLCLLCTLLVAVQFPIWGWSGQARGYEMMLLLGVISLLTGWRHLLQGAGGLPVIYILAVAMGMLTQPAFLFWWAGLFIGGAMVVGGHKSAFRKWVLANTSAGALTLILYLPLLTFSGLRAIAANPYVQPSTGNAAAFIDQLAAQHYLGGLFREWLPVPATGWLAPLLLVLAIFILFRSGKRQRQLALLALGIFGSALLMVLLLRKAPFYRVFIVHSWLYWVVVLASFTKMLKAKGQILLIPPIIALSLYLACVNRRLIPLHLYYYDVNAQYQKLEACQLPELTGKSVALSDESFLWSCSLKTPVDYGTAKIKGQDLMIAHRSELIPVDNWGYVLWKECGEFLIYRKN